MNIKERITTLLFDWGDTLMKDFKCYSGAMCFWEKVELIEGVSEVLPLLSKSYKCYVVTNAGDSDRELVLMALNRVGIGNYFKYIYTSKELGYDKSNKLFYISILKNINVSPSEVFMIGNDYKKDIENAKIVGINTIYLLNDTKNCCFNDYSKADYIIKKFNELYNILL